jgi:hypothetical protein
VGTTISQKYFANILSASRLRAHMGHPLAVEETISPQGHQQNSWSLQLEDDQTLCSFFGAIEACGG